MCISLYAVCAVVGFDDLGAVCLASGPVVHGFQGGCARASPPPRRATAGAPHARLVPTSPPPAVYRLFTSALWHAGLLHLAMNMLALVPMGSALERQMG